LSRERAALVVAVLTGIAIVCFVLDVVRSAG